MSLLTYRMSASQGETWRSRGGAAADALAGALAQILTTLMPDQVILVVTESGELAFAVEPGGGQ